MGTITANIHRMTSAEIYEDNSSAIHPVRKNTLTVCHRYIVGTDFTSGDNLVLMLFGAKKILFAVVKTPTNSFLAITEGAVTTVAAMGITLTTGTSTTDVEVFVVYEV